MKIVLTTLNSKFTHTSLALRLIGNWVNAHGHEAQWQEYTINTPIYNIIGDLHRLKPELLIFSVYIWNGEQSRQIAAQIKKLLPETIIVFGGPEVSFDAPGELEKSPFIDYIVKGEGESSVLKLIEFLKNQNNSYKDKEPARLDLSEKEVPKLSEISGLCYRSASGVMDQPITEQFDMDQLVFPYPDLAQLTDRILYYESSRGCPFNCSYCLSSATKGVRFKSVAAVKTDLMRFIKAGVRQVKWIDRTFNANPDRALEIWKFLADQDLGYTNFHFEITAELIREQDLQFLETLRPGLFQFEIGIQTTMAEAGEAVNRRLSFDKLSAPVLRMQSWENIHIHLDLIAGLPYESFDRFLTSFDQVYGLNPQVLQLGFLKLIKGSGIRNQEQLYGYIYEDYAPYEVLANQFISFDEILLLKDFEECLEHLHNSKRFVLSLKEILKYFPKASDFYLSFSQWLRSHGYFNEAIKSDRWYELIFEFINEHTLLRANKSLFATCLLIDYMASMGRTAPEWLGEILALTDGKAQLFELVKEDLFVLEFSHLKNLAPKERVKKIRYAAINQEIAHNFKEQLVQQTTIMTIESFDYDLLVVDPLHKHPVLERYPIHYYHKE